MAILFIPNLLLSCHLTNANIVLISNSFKVSSHPGSLHTVCFVLHFIRTLFVRKSVESWLGDLEHVSILNLLTPVGLCILFIHVCVEAKIHRFFM